MMLDLLTLLACAISPPDAPPAPPARTDRILIIVDTLRADAMHYAGQPRPTTPNLDVLASEATWFSRAYAASTWTLPSTASLFTGLPASKHRVVRDPNNHDNFGRLDDTIPTLASTLKAQGYRTAAFINNAFMAPAFGLNRGFDTYDYEGAGLLDHRTAQETVDLALAWLASDDAPAFLVVHVMEPHSDYQVAPPFQGRFSADLPHTIELPVGERLLTRWLQKGNPPPPQDIEYLKAVYHEEVLAADHAIGALLDGLRARAGWDEAVVAFTGDHGEEFWEFGGFEHGHIIHSVVTQVPLILKAPGVRPGRNDAVVGNEELFRVLANASGELLALARSGEPAPGRVAVMEDLLYAQQRVSAVADDLRFVVNLETHNATLYRLDEQGWEVEDLSGTPDAQRLAAPLKEHLGRLRGGFQPTTPSSSVAIRDADVFDQLRELGYLE